MLLYCTGLDRDFVPRKFHRDGRETVQQCAEGSAVGKLLAERIRLPIKEKCKQGKVKNAKLLFNICFFASFQLETFAHAFSAYRLDVSLYKMTKLNLSLIFGIIDAMVSYFVIMIQFDLENLRQKRHGTTAI